MATKVDKRIAITEDIQRVTAEMQKMQARFAEAQSYIQRQVGKLELLNEDEASPE